MLQFLLTTCYLSRSVFRGILNKKLDGSFLGQELLDLHYFKQLEAVQYSATVCVCVCVCCFRKFYNRGL